MFIEVDELEGLKSVILAISSVGRLSPVAADKFLSIIIIILFEALTIKIQILKLYNCH